MKKGLILEKTINDFKVGDRVSVHGHQDEVEFDGEMGYITDLTNSKFCAVEFDEKYDRNFWDCNGCTKDKFGYFIDYRKIVKLGNIRDRKLNLEEEPLGEEDWEYVQERMTYDDFEVGDRVSVHGHQDSVDFDGEMGYITIKYNNHAAVEFDTNFNFNLWDCDGYTKNGFGYFIDYHKLKKISNARKRKLNLEEDPLGEENWGYIQEKNIYEDLRNYYIPFETKEEMIDIAHYLNDLGYDVQNYENVIIGNGFGNKYHKFFLYNWDYNRFYRGDIDSISGLKRIEISKLKDFGNKKRILNLEDDPLGEEDYGFVKEFKKFIS